MIKYEIKLKYGVTIDDDEADAIYFNAIPKNDDDIRLFIDDWADIQFMVNFNESSNFFKKYTRKDFNDKINPEIFHYIKKFKSFC